jgi:hypothetical protein
LSGRHDIVVQGVWGGVSASSRDAKFASRETVLGFTHRVLHAIGLFRADRVGTNHVRVLVLARSWELLALTQMELIHVEAFTHGILSVILSAKSVFGFVLPSSNIVSGVIFVLNDFFHVKFLHVFSSNTETEWRSSILDIGDVVWDDLSHASCEISPVIIRTMRAVVFYVRSTYSKISEAVRGWLESSLRREALLFKLRFRLVAMRDIVLSRCPKAARLAELKAWFRGRIINSW